MTTYVLIEIFESDDDYGQPGATAEFTTSNNLTELQLMATESYATFGTHIYSSDNTKEI